MFCMKSEHSVPTAGNKKKKKKETLLRVFIHSLLSSCKQISNRALERAALPLVVFHYFQC